MTTNFNGSILFVQKTFLVEKGISELSLLAASLAQVLQERHQEHAQIIFNWNQGIWLVSVVDWESPTQSAVFETKYSQKINYI